MENRLAEFAKEVAFRPNPVAMKVLKNKCFIVEVVVPRIADDYYSIVLAGRYTNQKWL
ncbi:MAG TPA: hypothetical protein VKA49_08345 [Flavitalea sp.]|nr:hypothetical protein [Flavitalea sp.]